MATVLGVMGNATPSTRSTAEAKRASAGSPRKLMWPRNGRSVATMPAPLSPAPFSRRRTSGLSRRISSGILARSFRIDENGTRDARADHAPVGERRMQHFAHARGTALHERERDGPPKRGTVVARSHMAHHRHRNRCLGIGHQLPALGQHHVRLVSEETYELLAVVA